MNIKRKYFYSIICVFLATLMIVLSMSLPVGALSYANAISYSKIDSSLRGKLEQMDNVDSTEVYIFMKNIDNSIIESALMNDYGKDANKYENKYRFYNEVVPSIKVNNRTIKSLSETDVITSDTFSLSNEESKVDLQTRKNINREITNEMNEYIEDKRRVYSETIGNYTDSFIKKHSINPNDIVVDTEYVEVIIANLTKSQIIKIANDSLVDSVYEYANSVEENYSCDAVPLIQGDSDTGLSSDDYINYYGNNNDGTGITIGIIEAGYGKYDPNNYNLADAHNSGKLSFIATPGVDSSNVDINIHATYITTIICGKKTIINGKTYEGLAPGATVYQTAIYDQEDVFSAIEMFADMGVNIVNYSGGTDTGLGYDGYDKTVDRYIETLQMSLVCAAGKSGGNVPSPGKAYNAITVGAIDTKSASNTVLSSPYSVASYSCYLNDNYLANKPDVVAPGSNFFLPVSATEDAYSFSGTSYAAPLVTGISAQLMTDEVFYVVNPNALKNIVICGASNSQITGTTTSYGELKNESGAGLVNAVNSQSVKGNEFYGAFTYNYPDTDYETVEDIYIKKGETIRIVLTFEKEEDIALNAEYGNNLDIRLVQTAGYALHDFSESTKDNVEIIEFKATSSGTYNLQLRFADSILTADGNSNLHYWISWRIF